MNHHQIYITMTAQMLHSKSIQLGNNQRSTTAMSKVLWYYVYMQEDQKGTQINPNDICMELIRD